jgi:predicted DNA-binding transcriptional regulator AlpA
VPTYVLAPEKFREEAGRRLIDTWELMLLLGLRSRQGVWDRVESGKLPPPVYSRNRQVALWDKDEVEDFINTDRTGG